MKYIVFALLIFVSSMPQAATSQIRHDGAVDKHSFSIIAENPTNISRPDETVEIDLPKVKSKFPSFNEKAFFVFQDGKEIPSQLSERQILFGGSREIIFVSSFAPHEKKEFQIVWKADMAEVHHYAPMTQAALGIKVDYKKVNGYYVGGRFVDVDSATVPPDHFAHDALYRIEGPGWESDKIVYRFYLDSRNRNDIFGKKTHNLVLQKIGVNDLVSDSKESYSNMLDWGMDIFKVGESLGIGSIAIWHNSKVVTVSDVDKVECRITNGPIKSGVLARYLDWKVGEAKYNLFSDLTISAGSRLTEVNAFVNSDTLLFCTGLAKHDGSDLIKSTQSSKGKWAYLALYGKQSLAGDNLGIAIFYRTQDRSMLTEDGTSEIVVLRPIGGHVNYYFGAAWEQEPGGIKNEQEFVKYLDDVIMDMDNPIEINF